MEFIQFSAILVGYLVGSFPSAYIIGRLWGKVDIIQEGDGHVSATAVYRRSGLVSFITAIVLDVGKGALAVFIANIITDNLYIILAAGIATVVGHCWSVYIRFRGGLGATVIYGVLAGLVFWQFLIAFVIGVVVFFVTRKSTISTIIVILITSIIILITEENILLTLYPIVFILIQFIKRFQTRRAAPEDSYRNELSNDLKRVK